MVTRVLGALFRGVMSFFLIALPVYFLPGGSPNIVLALLILACFLALLVFSEYYVASPSIVEFRDAAPFNRLRFGSLFLFVTLASLTLAQAASPGWLTANVLRFGATVGTVLDFSFSPVRLALLTLPAGLDLEHYYLLRALVGFAAFLSISMLVSFVLFFIITDWPVDRKKLNLWTNLPLFDPTSVGDVVLRLKQFGQVNLFLGVVMPFLLPVLARLTLGPMGPGSLSNPLGLIWLIALWAFLPLSFLMRGLAMRRLAAIVAETRRRAGLVERGLLPA